MKTSVKRAAQPKRAAAAPAAQPRSQAQVASVVTPPAMMLAQVRSGPKMKISQVHPGVSPLSAVASRNTSFQPLPRPLGSPPYHYDLAAKFPNIGPITNRMVFHVVGDTGGVKDGEFQDMVAHQMIEEVVAGGPNKPQFCYHVGDVVYFTGMHDDYYAQFYEPYAHYEPPILSIPGNHDGEVDDPDAQTSLDGWVDYFMQAHPDVDPVSKDAPRVQLDLPNVLDPGHAGSHHRRPVHQRARARVGRVEPAAMGHARVCHRADGSGADSVSASPDLFIRQIPQRQLENG